MAADLVHHQVAVIAATITPAALKSSDSDDIGGAAYEKKAPPKRGKSLGRNAPKQEPQQGM
jgi:hypothetical protein